MSIGIIFIGSSAAVSLFLCAVALRRIAYRLELIERRSHEWMQHAKPWERK